MLAGPGPHGIRQAGRGSEVVSPSEASDRVVRATGAAKPAADDPRLRVESIRGGCFSCYAAIISAG
jgi:hypothetical protein